MTFKNSARYFRNKKTLVVLASPKSCQILKFFLPPFRYAFFINSHNKIKNQSRAKSPAFIHKKHIKDVERWTENGGKYNKKLSKNGRNRPPF